MGGVGEWRSKGWGVVEGVGVEAGDWEEGVGGGGGVDEEEGGGGVRAKGGAGERREMG